jgi:DnaK suppressor protein
MNDYSDLKSRLEAKLQDLLTRAVDIETELSDPGDGDWGESAIEAENNETLTEMEHITQQEIRDIKLALHRIESGTYGICSDCGEKIPKDRLAAIPFTSTCIRCA